MVTSLGSATKQNTKTKKKYLERTEVRSTGVLTPEPALERGVLSAASSSVPPSARILYRGVGPEVSPARHIGPLAPPALPAPRTCPHRDPAASAPEAHGLLAPARTVPYPMAAAAAAPATARFRTPGRRRPTPGVGLRGRAHHYRRGRGHHLPVLRGS